MAKAQRVDDRAAWIASLRARSGWWDALSEHLRSVDAQYRRQLAQAAARFDRDAERLAKAVKRPHGRGGTEQVIETFKARFDTAVRRLLRAEDRAFASARRRHPVTPPAHRPPRIHRPTTILGQTAAAPTTANISAALKRDDVRTAFVAGVKRRRTLYGQTFNKRISIEKALELNTRALWAREIVDKEGVSEDVAWARATAKYATDEAAQRRVKSLRTRYQECIKLARRA